MAGAKINALQAKEIRELYSKGGITQYQLADKYGLGQAQISRIIRNERWTGETKLSQIK